MVATQHRMGGHPAAENILRFISQIAATGTTAHAASRFFGLIYRAAPPRDTRHSAFSRLSDIGSHVPAIRPATAKRAITRTTRIDAEHFSQASIRENYLMGIE